MKVINIGSLNLDYVYQVNHMVREGETIASNGMEVFMGGKGFNQSVALARAGVEVYHAGILGVEGGMFFDACSEYGIQTMHMKYGKEKNGHTIIQIDKNGQNCIILYGGCNRTFTREYIDEILSEFKKGDYLILQNEVNLLDYMIDKAYEKGLIIVLNPSPFDANLERCNLNKISYFVMNEIEGEQITGEREEGDILTSMYIRYPNAKVLLTLGKSGAVYQEEDKRYRQGIYDAPVVDTTAAGDTFTGFFIAAIMNQVEIEESLRISTMASAIAVSRKGAATSIPTMQEVKERLSRISE